MSKATTAVTFSLIPGTSVAKGVFAGNMPAQEDGILACSIVLLDAKPPKSLNWNDAMKWAEKVGGYLPTRRELSLLRATVPEQFKPEWYWSEKQHASSSAGAWCQFFANGSQDNHYKSSKLRARAVRRLPI